MNITRSEENHEVIGGVRINFWNTRLGEKVIRDNFIGADYIDKFLVWGVSEDNIEALVIDIKNKRSKLIKDIVRYRDRYAKRGIVSGADIYPVGIYRRGVDRNYMSIKEMKKQEAQLLREFPVRVPPMPKVKGREVVE